MQLGSFVVWKVLLVGESYFLFCLGGIHPFCQCHFPLFRILIRAQAEEGDLDFNSLFQVS